MNALIQPVNPMAMTSLEISELTGSRHDSVKRTIETLAAKGVIEFPQSVEIPTPGATPNPWGASCGVPKPWDTPPVGATQPARAGFFLTPP